MLRSSTLSLALSLLLFGFFGLFGSGPDESAPASPEATDRATEEATLRVVATEEMPYTITWNDSWTAPDTTEGIIEEGEGYVDYPVPDTAFEDGRIQSIKVDASGEDSVSWDRKAGLGVILYVDGEIAKCGHAASRESFFLDRHMGIASVTVDWDGGEMASRYERTICSSYRFFR